MGRRRGGGGGGYDDDDDDDGHDEILFKQQKVETVAEKKVRFGALHMVIKKCV